MNQTASVSHQIDCQPAKDIKVGSVDVVVLVWFCLGLSVKSLHRSRVSQLTTAGGSIQTLYCSKSTNTTPVTSKSPVSR